MEHEEISEEQIKMTRAQKLKIIIRYPFFISICLGYFLVQLIKTLYTDWSQIYLTKAVLINHFKGIFHKTLLLRPKIIYNLK